MNYEEDRAISKFIHEMNSYVEQANKEFKNYIENPSKNLHKCLLDKYPYWKRDSNRLTKRRKRILSKPFIYEILKLKRDNEYIFTVDEKRIIYEYNIKKLCGIYKHAQALKTGYCNLKIINGFSIPNFISVCITKNSLEANEQWLERLYKQLDHRYPQIKLNDKIMIISSRKNTLNGNATHCKDMKDAWTLLKRTNNFNIIFVCSNSIRIHDILDMLLDFQNLTLSLQKKIQILHDEAHNPKEGIPPNRDIVENIVLQPNVVCYIPITATNKPLFVEDNPIWQETNLENEALDYSVFDKTTSSDPHYSSCIDSTFIIFEEIKKMTGWKNYGITQIPLHIFEYIHGDEYSKYKKYTTKQLQDELQYEVDLFDEPIVIDIFNLSNDELIEKIITINSERRRTLEFCKFMQNDKELEAINNGLNILHINEIMQAEIIIPGKFEIYIISTPNRRILTAYLAGEASDMPYNPIVLGIYGNEGDKYNLYCDGDILEVSEIMDTGEFNCKLDKLFTYLKSNGTNTNRPFIIIGNYVPTGESLTFVNYTYGTVRCNIKLISTSAEEDYQESARSNYMDTKFIEKDPNWTHPEKFLIGPSAYIENALSYEAENDARINSFLSKSASDVDDKSVIIPSHIEDTVVTGGIIAIPIKITVDRDHPETKKLVTIAEKSRRSPEDKAEFLAILKSLVEDEESGCEFIDKSGKFDFSKFKLKDFRSYKKKENGPKLGEWKFMSYKNHHEIKTPFINDKNNIDIHECEVLTCIDTYILKDEAGHSEKNTKSTWWMGYKYNHLQNICE